MKTPILSVIASISGLLFVGALPLQAQFGGAMGRPKTPEWSGSMAKLYGDNRAFTADVEIQAKAVEREGSMNVPGKIAFDEGKSRFEMDLVKGGGPGGPEAAAQMKAMGMDRMIMISRPDKNVSYMIYPGLEAYVENPLTEGASQSPEDFKVETTELGKETVDGHPTVKMKAVVTDKEGNKHESTIWSATDLKKFPVKIETSQEGMASTMLFKNVKLSKPETSQFDPPSGMKKYDNMMALMQQEMMKRMGGAGGIGGRR